jgi:hypothetical protein
MDLIVTPKTGRIKFAGKTGNVTLLEKKGRVMAAYKTVNDPMVITGNNYGYLFNVDYNTLYYLFF